MASACWEWHTSRNSGGYGQVWIDGRNIGAHRYMYEQFRGPIPEGLTLDHLCRNRGCVNPWHLEPVSMRTNTLRGESAPAENARKTHCIHGHELTEENIYRHGSRRQCRTCHRETARLSMQRRRSR